MVWWWCGVVFFTLNNTNLRLHWVTLGCGNTLRLYCFTFTLRLPWVTKNQILPGVVVVVWWWCGFFTLNNTTLRLHWVTLGCGK